MYLRRLNVALEQDAYCLLNDFLCAVFIALHFVQADVILAIAGIAELGHCDIL